MLSVILSGSFHFKFSDLGSGTQVLAITARMTNTKHCCLNFVFDLVDCVFFLGSCFFSRMNMNLSRSEIEALKLIGNCEVLLFFYFGTRSRTSKFCFGIVCLQKTSNHLIFIVFWTITMVLKLQRSCLWKISYETQADCKTLLQFLLYLVICALF